MTDISVNAIQDAIMKSLLEYGDVVYVATEKGLEVAEKGLIKELKSESPKDSGEFAKNWKGKGRRYNLRRYVGNTTTVKGKKSDTIPLSNILEYSTDSKHQGFIKRTVNNSADKIAAAVVAEIKKEV